jgi:cytochrome c5
MRSLQVRGWSLSAALATTVALGLWAYSARATEDAAAKKAEKAAQVQKVDGVELFNREWLPKDARAAKGDGLGPVFNDTSCVACHNQGGVGGAGPSSKNVDVITVFANPQHQVHQGPATLPEAMFRAMFGGFGSGPQVADAAASKPSANDPKAMAKKQKEELKKIHPGFTNARSVVLHKASTDPEYDAWRLSMKGQGHFAGVTFHAASNVGVDIEIAQRVMRRTRLRAVRALVEPSLLPRDCPE